MDELFQFKDFQRECKCLCSQSVNGFDFSYRIVDDDFESLTFLKRSEQNSEYLELTHYFQEKEESYILKCSLVYSLAYQFPSFFFLLYREDSLNPLSIEESIQFLNNEILENKNEKPQQAHELIYEAHPVNGQSSITFHSCRMRDLIKSIKNVQPNLDDTNLKEASSQTLLCLSLFLSFFRIYLPPQLFQKSI